MMTKRGYKCLMAEQSPFSVLWTGMATAMLAVGLVGCGSSGSGNDNVSVSVPSQPVVINVSSALVTPEYTLNGGAFPISEYDDGNFVLRSTTSSGDVAMLGSSHDVSPAVVRVIQDTYDVLYQHETGDGVPQNVNTVVQANEVVSVDRALPVTVTAWLVTPTFAHVPAAFTASEYEDGVFYLRPAAGGEDIYLGNSHSAMPDAVLAMGGSYDVIYALETGGDLVPNNRAAIVAQGVGVNAATPLAVNVDSVRFQLNATLDGGAFPNSEYQSAEFFLRNTTTGDRVDLGASFEVRPPKFVTDGTYDVVYKHVKGNQLPVNTDAVIASSVLIGSGGVSNVTIDIESVAITPSFTLDGGAFPTSEYSDANFYLRGITNENDVMLLGASEISPVAVRVISSDFDTDVGVGITAMGAYQVLYRHESGDDVPQNANAIVQNNATLNVDANLLVAVTSVNVTGTFTLNSNSFPSDASDSVQFLLRDASNDSDEFLFGFSDIANEAVKIIPGTYHVVMDHLDGDAVPQNEMHEVDFNNLLDVDTMDLPVNVTAVRVTPSFTLDGQAFPASIYQSATFYLRETHAPFNRIFLGSSYKSNDPVMVIQEDYDAIYEHLYGEETPQNTDNLLERIDL